MLFYRYVALKFCMLEQPFIKIFDFLQIKVSEIVKTHFSPENK